MRASALGAKRISGILGVHGVASSVRFHSRHNRLQGDRRDGVPRRVRSMATAANSASGERGMLSRALSLAAVMLLIGGFAAAPVRAQNLEAGKSPSQIFSGTCAACHKGARGLLRTVSPGSLPGFLRQHYTTSSEMAGVLVSYLISNGATDTRYGQLKGAKDARQEPAQLDRFGRPMRSGPTQEASR